MFSVMLMDCEHVISPVHLQQKLAQEEHIAEKSMYQSWVPVSLLRKLQQKSGGILLDCCDTSTFLLECQQLFTRPKKYLVASTLIVHTMYHDFWPLLYLSLFNVFCYAYGLCTITVVSPVHLQQKLSQEEHIAENLDYVSFMGTSFSVEEVAAKV